MMTDGQLNEFHYRLCVLMNEIHKLCVENDIRYTLLGGSLIGAVRHKGFIPWDDDMDIGMPWPDYKKFCEVASKINHEWIEIDNPFNTNCNHVFPKAYDARTTLRETGSQRSNAKGIFIDIFPLSYAGNSHVGALLEYKYHNICKLLYLRKKYHFKQNNVYGKILKTASAFFSDKQLLSMIFSQQERLNKKRRRWSSDLDGTTRGVVPSYLFDNYVLYDFDGFQFYGIELSDEYLTRVWGDYMKLPPVEKRVSDHFEYLNLNLPYQDYINGKEDEKDL